MLTAPYSRVNLSPGPPPPPPLCRDPGGLDQPTHYGPEPVGDGVESPCDLLSAPGLAGADMSEQRVFADCCRTAN